MSDKRKKAVVLLSGGLDSATALAVANKEGFITYPLTFNYNQRHRAELKAASKVAIAMATGEQRIIAIDLRAFGGSALTADIPVPTGRNEQEMGASIPVTYVPARNTIFLSFALAYAEVIGSQDIFIGVNALDYSGYPDCRPEFVKAFETVANLGTKVGVEGGRFTIHAPLVHLTKAEIIKLGASLGVDYSLTHSCYNPSIEGLACRVCDSCLLRKSGFEAAGVTDPTRYA